jgi:hypothetical protein
MREGRVFAAAAALVGAFGVCWTSTAIYRMESEVGSWKHAHEVIAFAPIHWACVVTARLIVAALLVWFAFWVHRRRRWAGFATLLVAIPLIFVADIGLWAFLDL